MARRTAATKKRTKKKSSRRKKNVITVDFTDVESGGGMPTPDGYYIGEITKFTDRLRKSRKTKDEVFSQRNWGQLGGMLKQTISEFRDLSDHYNLLLIAHERVFDGGDDDDEAIEPSIGARVMPSVGSFLDGAVDAIGSTFIKERYETKDREEVRHVDYCMRIGPHAFYSTKIRRPVSAGPIPELIVNPTFTKIRDLTSGKKKPRRKVRSKR